MLKKLEALATPHRRKWAYGVTTAGLTVLATYGVLNSDQLAAWLYLGAAVTGMATAKTDTRTTSGMPAGESGDAA
jgi:hypothetical protein